MTVSAHPLTWPDGWPRTKAKDRKVTRFTTGYAAAYDNLMTQLRLLGASSVTISSNAPLRRDGRPYTDAMTDNLNDPGVAVYFSLPSGQRVMARDGHPTPAENLHAIGHVIEYLRGIERNGGSYMMARAFSTFEALPAPGAKRPWREVLDLNSSDGPRVTAEVVHARYRRLASIRHPDVPSGSHEAMAELNAARDEALEEIGNG